MNDRILRNVSRVAVSRRPENGDPLAIDILLASEREIFYSKNVIHVSRIQCQSGEEKAKAEKRTE